MAIFTTRIFEKPTIIGRQKGLAIAGNRAFAKTANMTGREAVNLAGKLLRRTLELPSACLLPSIEKREVMRLNSANMKFEMMEDVHHQVVSGGLQRRFNAAVWSALALATASGINALAFLACETPSMLWTGMTGTTALSLAGAYTLVKAARLRTALSRL